ncbi:hypothetical protein I315_06613 [Cryptococcus gattii Ru294]|nr:hypothetical protein I315_06613 [Cryptococcus gattii Ru294]
MRDMSSGTRGGIGLRSARGHQWCHLVTNVMGLALSVGPSRYSQLVGSAQ